MSLARKPVGARPAFYAGEYGNNPQEGLTYREWLVGLIAAGLASDPNTRLNVDSARHAVQFANQIIHELIEEPEAGA